MIPDLPDYFSKFIPPRDSLLLKLEEEAYEENIPIVGPVVGEILHILTVFSQADKVLELGTATGYSTIYLARACLLTHGSVTTVELDPQMADRAHNHLELAGLDDIVSILRGKASEIMSSLEDSFDFVFLDIDKEGYHEALPHCERLLRPGGLLLADNVAFQEAVTFNEKIFSMQNWRTVHLYSFLPGHSPEMDGLCLALKL